MLFVFFGVSGRAAVYGLLAKDDRRCCSFFFFEEGSLSQEYDKDTDKNGRVGDVEDGTEKEEVIAADKRYPIGPGEIKQREEQHIDHLPVKPGRRGVGGMIVQQHAVEYTVNNIPYGAAEDQGHTPEKTGVSVAKSHLPEVVADPDHGHYAKTGEGQFSEFIIPPDAECHTRVQEVMQTKPFTDNIDLLVEIHIVVDKKLRGLVNNNDDKRKDEIFVDLHDGCLHRYRLTVIFTRALNSSRSISCASEIVFFSSSRRACVSV